MGVHLIFFFSSRRRHTSSLRDWSSDVCSSDLSSRCRSPWTGSSSVQSLYPPLRALRAFAIQLAIAREHQFFGVVTSHTLQADGMGRLPALGIRSEERRVGKEWRSRWETYDTKK